MPNSVLIAVLATFKKLPKHNIKTLTDGLRHAILTEALQADDCLPSSRQLANALGLARSTIVTVYEQLIAEGYLQARAGSATRVAPNLTLPVQWQTPPPTHALAAAVSHTANNLHLQHLAQQELTPLPHQPFSVAVPQDQVQLDAHWHRISKRIVQSPLYAPTGYGPAQGDLSLREQLVEYLRQARNVHCHAEQIIITDGAQQALYLASKVLLQAKDTAIIENPVYPGLHAVLQDRQVNIRAIKLDEQGMQVPTLLADNISARAVFVTPSHQYPMGMPLSMARRMALLQWAKQQHAWIVEDDYDSELRYQGLPFPAMQGLSPQQVIYIGTFSKVLAPSLRLGYVVVPPVLIDAFRGAKSIISRSSANLTQHTIAAYMQAGYFNNHIRRIRMVYAERKAYLSTLLSQAIPQLSLLPSDQGMHVVAMLPPCTDDVAIAATARAHGIALRAISPMCVGQAHLSGLMFGFGGFNHAQLQTAVSRLQPIIVAALQHSA